MWGQTANSKSKFSVAAWEAEEIADVGAVAKRNETPAPVPQTVQSTGGTAGSQPSPAAAPHKKIVLSANEAIRVAPPDASGKKAVVARRSRVVTKDGQFVRTDQFLPQSTAGRIHPEFIRWKQFCDELCKRPDLVAYYDFQVDEADRAVLRNRSASGKKLDGRIEGAKWTDGHLPGKQAQSSAAPAIACGSTFPAALKP